MLGSLVTKLANILMIFRSSLEATSNSRLISIFNFVRSVVLLTSRNKVHSVKYIVLSTVTSLVIAFALILFDIDMLGEFWTHLSFFE